VIIKRGKNYADNSELVLSAIMRGLTSQRVYTSL